MLKDKIESKLNEFIEDKDLYLVDIKITPQQKIMVFMDGKDRITIDQCVKVSRMLEDYLEGENLVKEKYILEVSSPGMDQPFRVMQQYYNSINRQVEVLKKDGIKYEGMLVEASEEGIQLKIEKKKKGRIIETNTVDILLKDIKATKKLITFK